MVQKALARTAPAPQPAPIRRQIHSVRQKIAAIELVLRIHGHLSFGALLQFCRSREEIIVAFFAVLELIKSCSLVASQDQRFGDIDLLRAEPNAVLEDEVTSVSEPELARI
jgi:chromatin segregation and condensation protein Rec8/ScpA/Scc1 (kleisin family)